MSAFNILHVTDFHIRDPRADTEHLGEGYYEEYIDNLARAIQATEFGSVDAIVATGDFVEGGTVGHLPHAGRVLHYLAEKLAVSPSHIALCPGNHDIVRARDAMEETEAARDEFTQFASQFGDAAATRIGLRASLGRFMDGLWYLMLDSTLGAEGANKAGTFAAAEVDTVMEAVRRHLLESDILIIASHHPVDSFVARSGPFDDASSNWTAQHVWWDAAYLQQRVADHRRQGLTLWLCGDIHRHAHFRENALAFAAAGRLGVSTAAGHGEIRREAELFQLEGERIAALRLEYEARGTRPIARAGNWTARAVRFKRLVEESDASVPRSIAKAGTITNLELIDGPYQQELLAAIATNNLYRFGRFETGGDFVSLAWVSIGPLLAIGRHLTSVVTRMANWVNAKVLGESGYPAEKVVVVGMNCWGAVFAAQISVLTGVRNYCVANRGEGAHNAPEELLNSVLGHEIRNASAVVLVTDVVASGHSLRRFHAAATADGASSADWYVLSLLCDAMQDRGDSADFIKVHGTLCSDLRMPVLPSTLLPASHILPPTLSFR